MNYAVCKSDDHDKRFLLKFLKIFLVIQDQSRDKKVL